MATVWDSGAKSSKITLGRGDTVAVSNADTTWKAVRATSSKSSGKWYLEYTCGYRLNDGFIGGFSNSSLNTASHVGSDGNSFGFQSQGSTHGITGGWQSMTKMGEVVQLAIDVTAKLVWARTDRSTNWNNSGTADPATGVGGKTYTTTGAIFPALSLFDSGGANSGVINSGGFTFTGTIPSGFTAWDTAIPSGTLNALTTTWDAASKNTNVTLSNGNLTASQSSISGTWCSVRSNIGASFGQVYFEITINAYDGGNGILLGIGDTTWSVATNNQYVGVDNHSTGGQITFGAGWQFAGLNTSGQPSLPVYTTSAVLGFAVDISRGLAWIKNVTTASNWNSDASADPVAGTRGAAIVFPGAVYIAASLYRNAGVTDTVTLNTGPSFSGTKPTGYFAWDSDVQTISETATAIDAPSVSSGTYNISISEAATATDTPSCTEIKVDGVVQELLVVDTGVQLWVDGVVQEVLIRPVVTGSITEAATATDTIPGGVITSASITETATATDLPGVVYQDAFNEVVTATDAVSGIGIYQGVITEPATAATDTDAVRTIEMSFTEVSTATDVLSASVLYMGAISEDATAAIDLSAVSDYPASITETGDAQVDLPVRLQRNAVIVEAVEATTEQHDAIVDVEIVEIANAQDGDGDDHGSCAVVLGPELTNHRWWKHYQGMEISFATSTRR